MKPLPATILLAVLLLGAAGCAGFATDAADSPPERAERTEGAEEVAPQSTPEGDTKEPAPPADEAPNPQEEWMASEEGQAAAAREEERRDRLAERVEITRPSGVPPYEILAESPYGANEATMTVSTEATSEPDMRLVAEDLRYENQRYDALTITFTRPSTGGAPTETGSAIVFNTREAALRSIRYSPDQLEAVFEEKNGILVLSNESLIAEQCRTWDYETLGEPPPEWDCEQYAP